MSQYAIRDWFMEWEQLIRAVDYAGARRMFDAQWRSIWGSISDFRFDLDSLVTGTSADGLTGWGLCLWTSTGYDSDHRPFARPGRATILLTRSSADAPWRGTHTHLSLVPGTAQQTFGA